MIVEIAQIDIKTGAAERFEDGVRCARELFLSAKGCHGVTLWRSVEHPLRYRLVVEWETVEHHTVTFRGSANFAVWRNLVHEFFASPPEVEHQEFIPLF